MPITASTGQQQALPVQSGARTLRTPNPVLAVTAPTSPGLDILSDEWTLALNASGTLSDDAVFALKAQINGSTFVNLCWPGTKTPITFTGAEIKAGGIVTTIKAKVAQIQAALTAGSTASGNGVTWRVLD